VSAVLEVLETRERARIPSRAFLGPHDIPPLDFAAYGIVAFSQKSTSSTAARHLSICEAYVATLPPVSNVAVPTNEQMVTVWPVENELLAGNLTSGRTDCKLAVEHYDLPTALTALWDARNQEGINLSGVGPYLLAWSPSAKKGKKDAIVLIADLSGATTGEQYLDHFRKWREEIEKRPELWRRGWSEVDLKTAIRNWADKWGTMILSVGHAQMNSWVKIATEQGLAFLIGLGFVSVIQPTTSGGTILLILIAVAVTNLVLQVGKLLLIRRFKKVEEQSPEDLPSDT
jgi:hypothetical protein